MATQSSGSPEQRHKNAATAATEQHRSRQRLKSRTFSGRRFLECAASRRFGAVLVSNGGAS